MADMGGGVGCGTICTGSFVVGVITPSGEHYTEQYLKGSGVTGCKSQLLALPGCCDCEKHC